MQIPRSSVVPPGGFHFWETSLQRVKIEGSSYEDVAQRVLRYRLDNGLPPGNPQEEVYRYVCETWPAYCEGAPREIQVQPAGPSHSSRAAAWMANFYRDVSSRAGVSPEVQEQRSRICQACPANRPLTGGCGSCIANIERLSFVWLRGREAAPELGTCDVFGQYNPVATWAAELPAGAPTGPVPESCWRRNLP